MKGCSLAHFRIERKNLRRCFKKDVLQSSIFSSICLPQCQSQQSESHHIGTYVSKLSFENSR